VSVVALFFCRAFSRFNPRLWCISVSFLACAPGFGSIVQNSDWFWGVFRVLQKADTRTEKAALVRFILIDASAKILDSCPMADDIILQKFSPNELEKEINAIIEKDQRALPRRAKVFAAIAKIQKFDSLPELLSFEELEAAMLKDPKIVELQRGISGTKGVPSQVYASELARGAMYPGTLSALGNGMYFATPSQKAPPGTPPVFPLISKIAEKYTQGKDGAGVLVRAALKSNANIVDCQDIKDNRRDNRNRARRAGITDLGTFAAALGFDAFFDDGHLEGFPEERVCVVLNRGALLVQNRCLMVALKD
jgi:hypothetical protein